MGFRLRSLTESSRLRFSRGAWRRSMTSSRASPIGTGIPSMFRCMEYADGSEEVIKQGDVYYMLEAHNRMVRARFGHDHVQP